MPLLLSFTYECDDEEDAQLLVKDMLLELMAEWEGTEMEYGSMIASLNSLDWLRGSYMDQVQEVQVDRKDDEETVEGSSGERGGEV